MKRTKLRKRQEYAEDFLAQRARRKAEKYRRRLADRNKTFNRIRELARIQL